VNSAHTPCPLNVAQIAAALDDLRSGLARHFDVDVLPECDSSNSQLLARAETGAASGSVIVAQYQTAGRGRRGRDWHSAPDDSLCFSLLWRFSPQTSLAGLSLAVGVALARALESLGASGIGLKWPNDLLFKDRKLAGILIELSSTARHQPTNRPGIAAVIGIGLNLRRPTNLPVELHAQTAALDEIGPLTDFPIRGEPHQMLAHLLAHLFDVLNVFAHQGFSALRNDWLQRHAWQGRNVRLLTDHAEPLEGLCLGVDGDGALLLETAGGQQRIISGEVSLRQAS
jgi:BirA family biotin operon repressor/biotin-[acetyl-CoA-carboxylase] ligase